MRFCLGQRWHEGLGVGDAGSYTWPKALGAVESLNRDGGYAGHRDWRIPEIDELKSLIEDKREDLMIDEEAFPKMFEGHRFWSASPYQESSRFAWYIDFYNGNVNWGNECLSGKLLLVRAAEQ